MMPNNRDSTGGARIEEADVNKGEVSKHTDPDPYYGDLADILLLTPKGEIVPRQDVKWERNPHAECNQDSSKLMVLVPGHHPTPS